MNQPFCNHGGRPRWWTALALLLAFILAQAAVAASPRLNVLFIAADDLRCDLGCFGNPVVKTPNLDRLAQRGRLFTRAYCQQALCNPSRASLMTGLRPDHTGVYNLTKHFRDTHPDVVTLPQLFKQNGYEAVGIGKLYHNLNTKPDGDPASWSRLQVMHWGNHRMDQPQTPGFTNVPFSQLPPTQCVDVPDEAYLDGRIAAAAIAALRELQHKPFFLGVGFWKPHLPYNAPKKYWDLYDRASLPPPQPAGWPAEAPRIAGHGSTEPRGYAGVPKTGPLSPEQLAQLRHGYLAAISFLDAQVGKVLDELERLGLADKTIIVLWGDNGYQLGEHTLFGKLSNFELDAHVPLLIATPGQRQPGVPSSSSVELVDVYPTLADLCGLTPPHALDGKSLRPILEEPARAVKAFALTQHPRPATLERINVMGYSLRTADFRYTEWRDWASGEVRAREFYDHRHDDREAANCVSDPALAGEVERHRELLAQQVKPPKAASVPAPATQVPGTVIDHSFQSSGLYIGSPSLVVLTNGDYLASHDFFGPKGDEFGRPATVVFRSKDHGQTWSQIAKLQGLFWHNLFVHRGAVYLMGTDKHHGRIVLRRSTDGGVTWTEPRDGSTGLLTPSGQYHTAPVPVVEHSGRLWRGFEDAGGGTEWGKRYRAGMLSVASDADLLNATNWTFSSFLPSQRQWLAGTCGGWLEGNAVLAPDGRMLDVLRVDTPGLPEKAALVEVSADGKQVSFDPDYGFVDFPGGAKKFTIRYDGKSGRYWALATVAQPKHLGGRVPGAVRNTLALTCSADLRRWEVRQVLLYHPEVARHGFQYVDWQFDGEDIIAVCRTAYDDAEGGAHNNHDANYLTFHRWPDFRTRTESKSWTMAK